VAWVVEPGARWSGCGWWCVWWRWWRAGQRDVGSLAGCQCQAPGIQGRRRPDQRATARRQPPRTAQHPQRSPATMPSRSTLGLDPSMREKPSSTQGR
jgi:hypothetical protein